MDPETQEARILSRYLLGSDCTERESRLYTEALEKTGILLSVADKYTWEAMMRKPWIIGPVDGLLALLNPLSPVRHRIFLMLAILETSPAYCKFFLAPPRSPFLLLSLALTGIRAGFTALAGIPVMLLLRLRLL